MAAISGPIRQKKYGDGQAVPSHVPAIGVAAGQIIYNGSLLCVETDGGAADGLLKVGATDISLACVGYHDGDQIDNSAGANSDYMVSPKRGIVSKGNNGTSISANDVGKPCYIVTDDDVDLSSNSNTRPFAGIVRGMDSLRVWVEVGVAPSYSSDIYNAPVLVSTASPFLANEVNLGALADGLLAVDVTAGVAAITNRSLAVGSAALVVSNPDGQAGNPSYDGSVALKALSAFAGTGFLAQTGGLADNGTFAERSLMAPAAGFTIANPAGVAGDPTFALANDLAALEGLATTGLIVRTADGAMTTRAVTAPAAGIGVTNGDGVAGAPTLGLLNDLAAVEGLAGTGIAVRSAADTWVQRSVVGPAAGISIANGDGVLGNPTLSLANDLASVEGLAANGIAVRTADGAWSVRSLGAPVAGLTITDPDGVAGAPTFVLADDLAALEALDATAGYLAKTGANAYSRRALTGTANQVSITNGDGTVGNPVFSTPQDIHTGATPGFAGMTSTGRITTTDGVAAGTAKVVGGRSYASLADSTVVTNIAAPTLADVTYPIPANSLKEGSRLKLRAICRSVAFNAADTHTYTLQVNDGGGADDLVVSPAVANAGIGANGRVVLEGETTFRAAPGAAVSHSSAYKAFVNNGASYTMGPAAGAPGTLASNAQITVQVLVTHSAQNAGNQSVLESLYVEII